ncbi:MAG TPA: M28 family peptidase [Ktedonobacterales bacterium]
MGGQRAMRQVWWLAVCGALSMLLAACAPADVFGIGTPTPTATHAPRQPLADVPTVDPAYIYDQLFYMATHFQTREAGYDTGLAPDTNGHDEFASYWADEMTRNLQGFISAVRRDTFPIQGWKDRPARTPATNVEVTVPGVTHPEQMVVIGCHYDAEAVSTQSAYDDASGCVIELGVAKAMAAFWRAHDVYPARTLRFVLFDAEEQGLYGSFNYLNTTVNGDVHNIVAMINEEQNGIAYPLRYLGKASNPLLPLYADVAPLGNTALFPAQEQLSAVQRAQITRFRAIVQQAVPAAFQQLQALGDDALTYHGDAGHDVSLPVFASDQLNNVHVEDDTLGGSDEVPFTLAGLPCVTFVGNATYYPEYAGGAPPPPWSYPFDQPEDTIQLMNIFASGSEQRAPALVLALGLPGMLTTWTLSQPDILGQAPGDGKPVAAIGDIGPTVAGQSVAFDAAASVDSLSAGSLTYAWSFGDGATASGVTARHTYAAPGSYTLTLTVRSASASRQITKTITVGTSAPVYPNPYADYQPTGAPPRNPGITLPTASAP